MENRCHICNTPLQKSIVNTPERIEDWIYCPRGHFNRLLCHLCGDLLFGDICELIAVEEKKKVNVCPKCFDNFKDDELYEEYSL